MVRIKNVGVLAEVFYRKNKAGEAWFWDHGDVIVRIPRGIVAWAYYPKGFCP